MPLPTWLQLLLGGPAPEAPAPTPPTTVGTHEYHGAAAHELLFDSAGDGFRSDTIEANNPPRVPSIFEEFNGALIRPAFEHHIEIGADGLNATSGAIVLWLHPSLDHDDAAQSTFGRFFGWQSGDERIQAYHVKSTSQLFFERHNGSVGPGALLSGFTFGAGDPLVVYCGWSSTQVHAAFNGGAITSANNTAIPTGLPGTFEVGRDQGALNRYLDGVFATVATFSRPLTASEWAFFASLGRPPLFGEAVPRGVMTSLWYGGETSYFDDANDQLQHDCRELSWSRGRSFGSQVTARSDPGRFSARLRNQDGRYSPSNASSPLYGMLRPGREIAYRSATPSQHYARWRGRLAASPRPRYSAGVMEAQIEAQGVLAELAAAPEVEIAAAANLRTSQAVVRVLQAAGWAASRFHIFIATVVMAVWWASRETPLEALRKLEDTELGFFWERGDGVLVFEGHQHRLRGESLVSQLTLESAAGATHPTGHLEPEDPLAEVINDVQVNVTPYGEPQPEEVLWAYEGYRLHILPGQTITVTARYPADAASAGSAYVASWATPDSSDIVLTNAPFSDLSISVVKAANTMEIALTNNGPRPASLSTLQARGSAAFRLGPGEVRVTDAASEAAYGPRRFGTSGPWLPDLVEADSYARFVLIKHAEPVQLLRRRSRVTRSEAHLEAMLGLEISQRVTVDATATGFGVDGDYFIESLTEHVVAPGGRHDLTMTLSSTANDDWPWLLGIDQLGVGTRLGW